MIKNYIKLYYQRWIQLSSGLGIIVLALFICSCFFHKKLLQIGCQLSQYDNADYSFFYVIEKDHYSLIESVIKDNECCLLPKFNVFTERGDRLAVESLMQMEKKEYHIRPLTSMNSLGQDEVAVSKNTANKYGLIIGGTLYTTYSIYSEPRKVTIKDIVEPNYGLFDPKIDNETGILYFGYKKDFHEKMTNTEYLCFSKIDIKTQLLSKDSQIFNSKTGKNFCYSKEKLKQSVSGQRTNPFIGLISLFSVAIVFSYLIFFNKSKKILQKLFLKGMQKKYIFLIPFCEKVVGFILVPLLTQFIVSFYLPLDRSILLYYFLPPIVIGIIFITKNFLLLCLRNSSPTS